MEARNQSPTLYCDTPPTSQAIVYLLPIVFTLSNYSDLCVQSLVLTPGNCEWVTFIECTNASGWVLPPCVIFKGKVYIEAWFDNLPGDWCFEVSPNEWTSDEIGLQWLEKLFIPSTITHMKGKYQLLILDSHGSHLTPKFNEICSQNNIIPICMLVHSLHLLQPLNISCFAVLK